MHGLDRGLRARVRGFGFSLLVLTAGCAAAAPSLPTPRPIVIHSGARIRAEAERVQEINQWVTAQQDNIFNDPAFWLDSTEPSVNEPYLWESMRINADTVWTSFAIRAPDSRLVHELYAHMHIMVELGRLDEWVPEAAGTAGYEQERAILARSADSWLLGRTVFDVAPYGPLDELMYANEEGFLDAFIFTARPNEFAEARADWARANPDGAERYRSWFLDTFNREPPGLRSR